MRTDLVEVHPRRLLVIAVLTVLGLAVAVRPPAPAVHLQPPAIERQVAVLASELDHTRMRIARIQDERARAEARHELARLERQLDEVANSLEQANDTAVNADDPPAEGEMRDGQLIRR